VPDYSRAGVVDDAMVLGTIGEDARVVPR